MIENVIVRERKRHHLYQFTDCNFHDLCGLQFLRFFYHVNHIKLQLINVYNHNIELINYATQDNLECWTLNKTIIYFFGISLSVFK